MANIISKNSCLGAVQNGPVLLKSLQLVTSVTYISKWKIKDQREEKVKPGETWTDIDFKRALIP